MASISGFGPPGRAELKGEHLAHMLHHDPFPIPKDRFHGRLGPQRVKEGPKGAILLNLFKKRPNQAVEPFGRGRLLQLGGVDVDKCRVHHLAARVKDGRQQRLFAFKVVVHQSNRNAGMFGDFADRGGGVAVVGEEDHPALDNRGSGRFSYLLIGFG